MAEKDKLVKDAQVLQDTMKEWMSGAGGSPDVKAVFEMLNGLYMRHGAGFQISEATVALDRLVDTAKRVKSDLIKRRSR